MVVNINGRWYTAGGVEYWYGLDRQGGPASQFTRNWYYSDQFEMEGWLCPALFKYFSDPPREIYVKVEPKK